MGDLTSEIPKPMLRVLGKNLIEHKLDALPDSVEEVIIVTGYLKERISNYFGDSYKGRRIKYAVQERLLGTGHALWQAKDLLFGKFLVMMGDDIYCKTDIEKCTENNSWTLLVEKSKKEESAGGRVILDENGVVREVIEGKHKGEVLISAAMYSITKDIFKYELVKIPGKEEWGLPQTIASARKDFPIKAVESAFWIQITDQNDLKKAENILGSIYGAAVPEISTAGTA